MAATRVVTVHYQAHGGQARPAYVLLPSDVGPANAPALPLVVPPRVERIKQLNPKASVTSVVGTSLHSQEMTASTRLPEALEALGLTPPA